MSQLTMNVTEPPAVDLVGAKATHRKDIIIYWIATLIVSAVMTFSVLSFTFYDHFPFPNGTEGAFVHLGLPSYFKVELTTAKAFGILALLIPSVPHKIKEFAYFGFGITLVSATIAHLSVGDAKRSLLYIVDPPFFLMVLIVSYAYFNKLSAGERRAS